MPSYALKLICLLLLNLTFTVTCLSQQLTGKIIDQEANPVAYAHIQYRDQMGVASNLKGVYTLNLQDYPTDAIFKISALGYKTVILPVSELKEKPRITLVALAEELGEVILTSQKLDIFDLLQQVYLNYRKNHNANGLCFEVLMRESDENHLKDAEFEVDKASFLSKALTQKFNRQIKESLANSKNNLPSQQRQIESKIYITPNQDSLKLKLLQVNQLRNERYLAPKNNFIKETFLLIQQGLDSENTFKIKSGMIPLGKNHKVNQLFQIDSSQSKSIKTENERDFYKSLFFNRSPLNLDQYDFIQQFTNYNWKHVKTRLFQDELVYELHFTPKNKKADYSGKLYISKASKAILQASYQLAENRVDRNINLKFLLGLKYVANVHQAKVIFKRDSTSNRYLPQYINWKTGQYIYINRPLKLKENNTKSSEKTKLKLNFKIEQQNNVLNELMLINPQPIAFADFKAVNEKEKLKILYTPAFDESFWLRYNKELEASSSNE